MVEAEAVSLPITGFPFISARKALKHERKQFGQEFKTDWARLDAMTDEGIDTSDIPPLDAEFFANAELPILKAKSMISMRVDSDVLAWFKEQGAGYQTRMNAVLRLYMEAQTRGNEQRQSDSG